MKMMDSYWNVLHDEVTTYHLLGDLCKWLQPFSHFGAAKSRFGSTCLPQMRVVGLVPYVAFVQLSQGISSSLYRSSQFLKLCSFVLEA